MMAKKKKEAAYRVTSVIVCEDVRREVSGKEFLIGVYNRSVIFPHWPGGLRQLVVRLAVEIIDLDAKKYHLQVSDQDGNVIGGMDGDLEKNEKWKDTVIILPFPPMAFERQTELLIKFGIDRDPEVVHSILIRVAETEEERARFPK